MTALALVRPPGLCVLPARPADLQWLERQANWLLTRQAQGMRAVDDTGRLRGVVAYDVFTPNSCQMHVAATLIDGRALAPVALMGALLPACLAYPFETLGLGLVVANICTDNPRSLRLASALGFRETYRMQDAWAPGQHMVTHELRRDEWRARTNGKEG